MLCKGKILREGPLWHCVDCGHASTAFNTRHEPLQSRVENFLMCLVTLARDAIAQTVQAGEPA